MAFNARFVGGLLLLALGAYLLLASMMSGWDMRATDESRLAIFIGCIVSLIAGTILLVTSRKPKPLATPPSE